MVERENDLGSMINQKNRKAMNFNINKIALLLGCSLLLGSCSINDNIDDLAAIGNKVPNVYWEQVSSSVKAGQDAKFELQYYSYDKNVAISDLSVWYSIYSKVEISASCPIVSTFTYNVSSADEDVVREFVPVMGYTHDESLWNEEKRGYFLKGTFPTTYTLAPVSWTNIEVFDQEKFDTYFPENFAEAFRDSVYVRLQVEDYRKIFTVVNSIIEEDDFANYIDTVFNENAGRNEYSVKPEFVEDFKNKFYALPLESLFFNTTSSTYDLSYQKSYQLKARFKVTDARGMSNMAEEKIIELQ